MKKSGILNAQLACELAKIRHLDTVMLCDIGFPIPKGANWGDVSLIAGLPNLQQVLEALLNEMIFEHYTIVNDMEEGNPEAYRYVTQTLAKLPRDEVTFAELRERAEDCKLLIRTGEAGRRCNVLLRSASGVRLTNEQFDITPGAD